MPDIVIIGASGFGRELIQYVLDSIRDLPDFRIKGMLDDDPTKLGSLDPHSGIPVIGDSHSYPIQSDDQFLISVGDPRIRQLLSERMNQRGAKFFTLQHPTAYVAESATVGEGCIIGPFASVRAYAELDRNVLVNLYSAVGHDSRVGCHSVFSPYAVANGGSNIGDEVFLGSHAVVTPQISIGNGSKIAAAAVVYRNVPNQSMVTGNPAKAIPLRNPTQSTVLKPA